MPMILTLLLVVQILSALAIIALVLLQQGKGADMGSAFGGGSAGSLFGAAGAANFLSRSTKWAAVVFFCATAGLAYFGQGMRGNQEADVGIMEGFVAPDPSIPQVEDDIPEAPDAAIPAAPDAAVPAAPDVPAAPEAPAAPDVPAAPEVPTAEPQASPVVAPNSAPTAAPEADVQAEPTVAEPTPAPEEAAPAASEPASPQEAAPAVIEPAQAPEATPTTTEAVTTGMVGAADEPQASATESANQAEPNAAP